ncbi:MAG: aconitase X swivel domain-containing protein [Burkholderiales bacterium]
MTNVPALREFQGRGLVPGVARGPALVSWDAISFLGDVDIRSGRIVGDLPSIKGACVAGTILIMPTSRGSAGAWRFIYQMEKHGTHPLALLFGGMPDPSVVQGAILAGIPVIANVPAALAKIITKGDTLDVDGESGMVRCIKF